MKRNGQTIVEFAIVMPLFLVVFLGIVDFGFTLHAWVTLNQQCVQAVRAGAKRIHQLPGRNVFTSTTHEALETVEELFWYYQSPIMKKEDYQKIAFTGIGTNSQVVSVTSEYRVAFLTPFLGSLMGADGKGYLMLHASAEERKE